MCTQIWDYESGQIERTLKGHTNAVQCVAFSPSGALLASCSADLSIKLWDFTSFECLRTMRGHDHNVSSVLFLPSGDQVVSCSRDQSIKFWDTNTGYCIRTISGTHTDWVRCLALNAEGSLLASAGNDACILIWNVGSGRQVQALREHEHVVETIAFSNTEADIVLRGAAAGSGVSSIVPAVASAAADAPGSGVGAALGTSGSTTGQFIISGSRDRSIRIFSVLTGLCVALFRDNENWVRAVTFHPNGKFALSVAEDKTIRVFDLKTSRCIRTLADAHNGFITSLAMHPTLPFLITGGVDRLAKVWECV